MDYPSIVIDCKGLDDFLSSFQDLLKHKFKVHCKIEQLCLRLFGDKESLDKCKALCNYFKTVDSHYILDVNYSSEEAFTIKEFLLLFQYKCTVLLRLNDSMLHIYGELKNVTLLYDYFLKSNRLVALKDVTFMFEEDEEIRLGMLCSQYDIALPTNLSQMAQIFIYNILMDCEHLFSKIVVSDLNKDLDNLCVRDDDIPNSWSAHNNDRIAAASSTHGPLNYQVTKSDYQLDGIDIIRENTSKYRTVVIDGSNLAFGHGVDKFSSMGIKIAVDYFINRGHTKIYVMLPRHRQSLGGPIFDQLERDDRLKYTPSRKLNNIRETPYDDRLILEAARVTDGVVLSNDQYRDLMDVEQFRDIISNRLIPYTFIGDHLIIPNDPRGANGPSLSVMLTNKPIVVAQERTKRPRNTTRRKSEPRTVNNRRNRPQTQLDLNDRQRDLFNRVKTIITAEPSLIKQIILGNPTMFDPYKVANFVTMASHHSE